MLNVPLPFSWSRSVVVVVITIAFMGNTGIQFSVARQNAAQGDTGTALDVWSALQDNFLVMQLQIIVLIGRIVPTDNFFTVAP